MSRASKRVLNSWLRLYIVASTKRVVIAALVANFLIAVLKFAAWSLTGSSSMLSEAYHSVSDTGNQVLLLLGLRLSDKGSSPAHPFGRGKEQYFFAFVVAVLLFGVAGYASLSEGIHRLGEPYHDRDVFVNYVVLGGALAFESYALKKAWDGIQREMDQAGWESLVKAYRNSKDATLITALTEDTVAILGLLTAAASVFLTEITRNNFYDAVGSMIIGLLLMGFSLALAWENRGLIVGEGANKRERSKLLEAIRSEDTVAEVLDFRTLYMGADNLLVAVDVRFDEGMTTAEIEEAVDRIEEAIREASPSVQKIYIEPEKLD